ncbi:conserved hypothetical protein [delta proteobacterium NaphS2]|nr:conserved hypothetical protein [delta proteobacterium NaphS2]
MFSQNKMVSGLSFRQYAQTGYRLVLPRHWSPFGLKGGIAGIS